MNSEILLESATLRSEQLAKLNDNQAIDALNKAKALIWANIKGTGAATTEQIADYYEVSAETVLTVLKRNRSELETDGLKVLRNKDLKEVTFMLNVSPNTSNLTLWTPRAALRLGMLLRDSAIAVSVRNCLLDLVQPQPHIADANNLQYAQTAVNIVCDWLKESGVNPTIIHQFKLQELPKLEPSIKGLCENARKMVADNNPLKGQLYTPTELGLLIAERHQLSKPPLGQAVNSALALAGFQTKVQKLWVPTEKGRQFSEVVTFSAQHNSKSGTQLKWYDSVTSLIARSFLSTET